MPVLGGAACLFKRAIPPFGRYEVVTRVLAWDEKWVFLVSWFVKAGSMGKKSENKNKSEKKRDGAAPGVPKNVYATAVAKYVVKAGRDTVKPEDVLRASRLLPEGNEEELARIEKERVRALVYGKAFCELDRLHAEFDGDVDTLGHFKDLL